MGVVGLVFDGISLVNNLTGEDKDLVGAGLDATAIGGSAALMLATGPVGITVGAILFRGATAGKLLWGNHKESIKYETETTEKFLRNGGMNSNLTYELRNQDGDGNSPASVFKALAKITHTGPKTFFDYLNTLSPDKVHKLVEKAHEVDRDADGNVLIYDKNYLKSAFDESRREDNPYTFDLDDFGMWMQQNGYADAPGI